MQTIKASLEQQLNLAMQGGLVDAVKKLQSQTGMKEFFMNDWISKIIPLIKKLKAEKKAKDEIYMIMRNWFDQQPGLKMNPLLDVTGKILSNTVQASFYLVHGVHVIRSWSSPWHTIWITTYLFLGYHEVQMVTCHVQDIKGPHWHPCGYVWFSKDCLDTGKGDASYIWLYSHALNGQAALQIPVRMPTIAAFQNSHQSWR